MYAFPLVPRGPLTRRGDVDNVIGCIRPRSGQNIGQSTVFYMYQWPCLFSAHRFMYAFPLVPQPPLTQRGHVNNVIRCIRLCPDQKVDRSIAFYMCQ